MEKSKILLVDDEHIIRQVLTRSLSSAGFSVVTAVNGLEALERLKDSSFDAMITDSMMPIMDGISLLLESREKYPNMPVLIITGFSKDLSLGKAKELGACDLLAKPFKNQELILSVRRAIISSKRSAQKIKS